MWWFNELWERWFSMLTIMREEAASRGTTDMWMNLTNFAHPSPWMLQWGNSIWMCNSGDLDRVDNGLKREVDLLLSYRDGCHYDFSRIYGF